jgi:NADPH-dependent curcumin reductase CurA
VSDGYVYLQPDCTLRAVHSCVSYCTRSDQVSGPHNACQPNAGETLIVSGAAGAGGSLVFQLGKRVGARVIGIAGAAGKCARLEKFRLRRHTFHEHFKKAVGYLDVYFDIVGGDMLDSMPSRLNKNACVVLYGP